MIPRKLSKNRKLKFKGLFKSEYLTITIHLVVVVVDLDHRS